MSLITDFVQAADERNLQVWGIEVLKDGVRVDGHHWVEDDRMNLRSGSKSFTSAAVGIAMSEGYFSREDRIARYFEDKLPRDPSPLLLEMRVEDLLKMASGHERPYFLAEFERWEDDDLARHFLGMRIAHQPGSVFMYNGGCTYMLSALLQRTTGIRLRTYIQKKIFDALDIRNVQWLECPMGVSLGNSGLMINTVEAARFGQLLLQHGEWEGKQLIPRDYLELATTPRIATNQENVWYGYQFWGERWEGAYSARGKYGQFILVLPKQNAVIAITAHNEKDPNEILDAVDACIMPKL